MPWEVRTCQACAKPFEVEIKGTRDPKYCSVACKGVGQRRCKRPSKAELQLLIERLPVSSIARTCNVSGQAVLKWCKNHGIKTKPRGYWNKVYAGKTAPKQRPVQDHEKPTDRWRLNADIDAKFAPFGDLI